MGTRGGFVTVGGDGTALQIRDARPEDEPAIEDLLETLSPRSVYQRFLSASPRSAYPYAQRLFDPTRTLDAVVATLAGELVAVGSTHPLSSDSAEFALAIADVHQGHGLGTLVLEALVDRARAHGLADLVGEILVGNEQMLDVLRHLGLPVTFTIDAGIAEATINLSETPDHQQAMAHRAARARDSAEHHRR